MEKIIDRIQKLLALAGNNPSESEAAAALEKAHELLAQHNLSMQEVEASGGEKESTDHKRESLKTETNLPERHYRMVWLAVAELHYCKLFTCRPNPKRYQTYYTLVGRHINVLVATQLALYLCQAMRRATADHAKSLSFVADHAYKNAFIVGMADRLCQRIAALRESEGNALVLWSGDEENKNDAFIKDVMGITLRTRRAVGPLRYDRAGLERGRAAANGISLNQQVDSRSEPRRALS